MGLFGICWRRNSGSERKPSVERGLSMCPLDVPWIAARWADGGSGPLPLPVPESRLLNVEAHWSQALTPEWNRAENTSQRIAMNLSTMEDL